MIKSLRLSTALLSVVLLMGEGTVTAGTTGRMVPRPFQLEEHAASFWSPTSLASLMNTRDDKDHEKNRKNNDEDNDNKEDKHKDKDDHAPSPVPEPSTILLLGIALLTGAGILLSRRLGTTRK
jgi:hypothetical protein